MAIEFTVTDISDVENIEMAFKYAGENLRGQRFVLHMGELHRRHIGGLVRIEDADGNGYDVGRVGFTTGSFSRPILTMTTFNSDVQLLGTVMMLLADDRKMSEMAWKDRMGVKL